MNNFLVLTQIFWTLGFISDRADHNLRRMSQIMSLVRGALKLSKSSSWPYFLHTY